MTTQTEALKLALEALIGARAFLESDAPVEIWSLNDKAITAIKEALAQPEQEPLETPLPCDVTVGHVTLRKGVALSTLVARMQVLYDMAQASVDKPKEPEHEPVAIYQYQMGNGSWIDQEKHSYDYNKRYATNATVRVVYTTPPQRKPLTSEEFDKLHYKKFGYCVTGMMETVRMVEAAHGIKE